MTFLKNFVSGIISKLKLEPVAISGLALAALTVVDAQLQGGATMETALGAGLMVIVTFVVRQNVWPSVKVDDATGAAIEPLEAPLTGLDD